MGNGIPAKLPTTEEHWDKAQKVMDRLESAMLEQQKKELNPDVLEGAIDVAEVRYFVCCGLVLYVVVLCVLYGR